MTERSPLQRLADMLLDEPVEDYIARKRAESRSWRLIARDLATATDGEIDVTTMTLQAWHKAATERGAAA